MLTPKPSGPHTRPKPGFPMLLFFGVDPAILDTNLSHLSGGGACVVRRGVESWLVVTPLHPVYIGQGVARQQREGKTVHSQPTPGMARTIYNNHERFLDTYY